MENTIKRKVNRIGLVGQIISIILIVLMSAACFGCILAGVALSALPKDTIKIGVTGNMDVTVSKDLLGEWMNQINSGELNAQLGINGTEYSNINVDKTSEGILIRAESDRIEFRLIRLACAAFSGLVYCALLLVVFVFLKRLFDGFRHCDSPFSDDVIRRMTVFSWVLLGSAVLMSVAESIGNSLINRSIDLSFTLNPTGVNSGFEFSFSFAPILIALLILFLTMIFRYGAKLQKEADETL